ncbi:phosphotransferase [Brucella pseudogrignonensis]|uniref:Hydroxylysine kinase n=1 Tax=Brucella pseudogrignonensis TaxID=419475 RepID=A0ABU1ME02_9HYPH|nr:phosphotransferase [Brucella pseudogrignonensis]MDR6433866.1 Ser/Thr protein kinase RdoA (MazF antagonist) [Brucella pseudogrignonensis]
MMERLTTIDAETLTRKHFGVNGQATELGGERTQNFRIRVVDGATFTLKVSDPQESIDSVLLENAALLHIEQAAPEIPAPRVTSTINGETIVPIALDDGRYLRLLTYLEGTPLSSVASLSRELRQTIGRSVANLDNALSAFDHAYAHERDLVWDVKNISLLRAHLRLIDADRRPLAQAMLDRFETVALPRIAQLPTQAVHSDMNGQNILISGDQLAGFLDFGDLVYAPRLVDLAGAALLQIRGEEDDFQNAADVVSAYHSVAALSDLECTLLPEFMIARCVINVIVTEFLADSDPANRPYIMKNNPASWMRLKRLSALSQNPFSTIHQK